MPCQGNGLDVHQAGENSLLRAVTPFEVCQHRPLCTCETQPLCLPVEVPAQQARHVADQEAKLGFFGAFHSLLIISKLTKLARSPQSALGQRLSPGWYRPWSVIAVKTVG